ncbi:MAG: DUF433 domain-containing protein [Candidatus Altiarchaeales archaeon]|nr:DUF433 domain-containing protein [Candidatus Altiarchaeales archaeon]
MENPTTRIIFDPRIRHGKPIIKGTRVPVEVVLGSLAGGMNIKEICKEYEITKKDVLAAIDYANKIISHEEIKPLKMTAPS